jgi:site-specific recombinase XerD
MGPLRPDQLTSLTLKTEPSISPEKGQFEAQTAQLPAQDGTSPGTGLAQEKRRTLRLRASLPEGVSLGVWSGDRPKKFFVRFGASRSVESFALERDRNDRAEELGQAVRREGQGALDYTSSEVAEWVTLKRQTGATAPELKFLWERYHGLVRSTKTVGAACSDYQALRENEGLAEDSRRHTRVILRRFADYFGELALSRITAEDIRRWLGQLKDKHCFQSTTLRHHRKDVAALFARAKLERWVTENPCDAVIPPPVIPAETTVLSLVEAKSLFQAAQGSPIAGKLALEAFAGLRCSSAARLLQEDVEMGRGVTFRASEHKLRKRFFIENLPKNLWAWLRLPDNRWEMSESSYDKYKRRVFDRAGVELKHNVLRHSFATYHLAAFSNPGQTALILTHRGLAVLEAHYRGKGVGKKEGYAYFKIAPS